LAEDIKDKELELQGLKDALERQKQARYSHASGFSIGPNDNDQDRLKN